MVLRAESLAVATIEGVGSTGTETTGTARETETETAEETGTETGAEVEATLSVVLDLRFAHRRVALAAAGSKKRDSRARKTVRKRR